MLRPLLEYRLVLGFALVAKRQIVPGPGALCPLASRTDLKLGEG